MDWIDADSVVRLLGKVPGSELAILDSRGEMDFASGHLYHASCAPVERLEALVCEIIPRADTPVVLVDAGEGSALRAARIMEGAGFGRIAILDGGVRGWLDAGHALYDGVNVPSKTLGAIIRRRGWAPTVAPEELMHMATEGADFVVVDCRSPSEFARGTIPGAISCPGERLPLLVDDIVPDPDTLVVITCAGRTRSIATTRSLLEFDSQRRVAALDGGTMAWQLAGFDLEIGSGRVARVDSPDLSSLSHIGHSLLRRLQPSLVTPDRAAAWLAESGRTTLFLDVRSPEDRPNPDTLLRSAPGTSLLLATDRFVAVLGARVVLVDDAHLIRASLAWQWLSLMGLDAHVLDGDPRPGWRHADVRTQRFGSPRARVVSAQAGVRLLESRWKAIDVSFSDVYRAGHIPGALWVRRMDLGRVGTDAAGYLVVGDDEDLARRHADELHDLNGRPVAVIRGGLDSWRSEGLPLEVGATDMLSTANDRWIRPSDTTEGGTRGMRDYLDWADGVLSRVETDPLIDGWVTSIESRLTSFEGSASM
jgi:rhodanese-related sulfurtransferase